MEPGPVLPTAEGWISVYFTATYIKVGVLVYSPAVGDQFFLNRMELYEYNGGQGNMVFAQNGSFTYQYHLKDHLGNVRLTFTTKDEKDISKATMETANSNTEQGQFLYYDEAVKVNSTIFDHTDVGTTWYSTRLNGSTNERFGLAKSLSVMPGDTVRAEVYAKYLDPNSSNWTAALNSLITSIGNGTAPGGTFIDGGLPGSTGGVAIPYAGALDKASETGSAPKAFLNYIVFDRDFNFKDGGYVRITTAGREYGQDAAHEKLAKELVITEPGYVYLYISNDNVSLGGGEVEVYWDDFRVEHIKSPVVQSQDYYPFGLTFDNFSRENSPTNRYLYNQGGGDKKFNTERIIELDLNVDQSQYRTLDFITGKWWQADSKGDKAGQESWSNYQFAFNNPIRYNDPRGDCPPDELCSESPEEQAIVAVAGTAYEAIKGLANIALAPFNKEISSEGFEVQEREAPKTFGESLSKNLGNGLQAMSLFPASSNAGFFAKTGVGGAIKVTLGKTLKDQAADLAKLNNGNRVTLRSEKLRIDADLAGDAHFSKVQKKYVETPHIKKSPRNLNAPNQPAYNTAKTEPIAMTQKDISMIRKYIESLLKK